MEMYVGNTLVKDCQKCPYRERCVIDKAVEYNNQLNTEIASLRSENDKLRREIEQRKEEIAKLIAKYGGK